MIHINLLRPKAGTIKMAQKFSQREIAIYQQILADLGYEDNDHEIAAGIYRDPQEFTKQLNEDRALRKFLAEKLEGQANFIGLFHKFDGRFRRPDKIEGEKTI